MLSNQKLKQDLKKSFNQGTYQYKNIQKFLLMLRLKHSTMLSENLEKSLFFNFLQKPKK